MAIQIKKWAVGIIIFAGLLARLFHIDQPLLEFFPERQTQTAEITRNIYMNGWSDFWTPKARYFTGLPVQFVVEFPLYNGIIALIYRLFGPNIILGRLVSMAFFVFSSITFYKILVSHSSPNSHQSVFILSLIFFVFSPIHILISRSYQPEEIAFSLLLLAIQRPSWIFFSLAVLTKLPIVLFAPVLFYQFYKNGITSRRIIAGFSVSLIAPIVWFFRARTLATNPELIRNAQIGNWFQAQLLFTGRWYVALFQIEQMLVLTTLGLLFFWVGIWHIKWKKSKFWIIWFFCELLYVVVFNYHAMTHEYYHLLLLPPLAYCVGVGLNQILNVAHWKKIQGVLFISGILVLFISGLLIPSLKKISGAPKTIEESEEVSPRRYQSIMDF